jgi:NAD(P)-dependent dehydrogenase (short-subunit alcohol dehydrogenase family)
VAETPDGSLASKICVITGATSGIGQETALGLARAGWHLALIARSQARAEATLADIQRQVPGATGEIHQADLSSQAEIRRAAKEIRARHAQIHLLVNNAGIVNFRRETTPDGLEATFAVNHLAYFLLTELLLPALRDAAPARIVNVSSDAHRFGVLDFDDLQSERGYRWMRVYGRSKTANLLFTQELARRLAGSGVTVNCLHPGAVSTRLGHQHGWWAPLLATLLRPFFRSPARGAETSIYLATSPEVAAVSGRYFKDQRAIEPASHATDERNARRLWDLSAALCGLSGNS